MKKLYSFVLFAALFIASQNSFAQYGSISVHVTDKVSGEVMPVVTVGLYKSGDLSHSIRVEETDDNGDYTFKPVVPGSYSVKFTFTGKNDITIDNVVVSSDVITPLKVEMSSGNGVDLGPVDVYANAIKNTGGEQKTVTGLADIKQLAIKGGTTVDYAGTAPGVIQKDDGKSLSVNGGRDYGTTYYIDGVKVRGALTFPAGSIDQIEVITGGLPARFGDVTGAVISITTRGPSQQFFGGIELGSSEFVDPYGFNLASLNLTGPIVKAHGIDAKHTKGSTFSAGYFLTAEFEGNKDGSGSTIGMYKVRDDVYDRLKENPLRPSTLASGFVPSAEFLTMDSLEHIKYKRDIQDQAFRFNLKIDIAINKNVNFTIGGNAQLERYVSYSYGSQLMTPGSQLHFNDNTFRMYGKFTQSFPTAMENGHAKSPFSNAYYSVQLDYTKFYRTFQDPALKDNLFEYGYIGKFNTYRTPVYIPGSDTVGGNLVTGWVLAGYADTMVQFTAADINPLLTNYTEQFYALAGTDHSFYNSLSSIQQYGGLINGQGPPSIYSLWSNIGSPTGNYGHRNNDQFRMTVFGNVDYVPKSKLAKTDKKGINRSRHALQFGFEYEQRTDRLYTIAPRALWTLARQLANSHILNLDLTNAHVNYAGAFAQDTINYDRLIGSDQSAFDKALRDYLMANPDVAMAQLGELVTPTTYINTDNLDPSIFKLSYFSPDELFQDGGGPIFYYGYDYLGNVLKKQPSFDDFFTQKDANGNYTRNMAAFRPIYTAAYIQDQFSFKDLNFTIGLRVDRFDANQKVPKDKYVLYPTYSVGELGGTPLASSVIPSTIGSDYVVYVNDPTNPSSILGFRNGDTWYNAQGTEVSDPKVILPLSGKIAPYLKATDLTKLEVTGDAFKDYDAQFTFMPRVAFAFPISEDALFFAHYDVLSQRPSGGTGTTSTGSTSISSPFVYYYLRNISVNNVIENPSLKPEKTIDYQVGFTQKLGSSSQLTISGQYRELKNMVQVEAINYAYPQNYKTFGNEDFGTVKSLIVSYDMARTQNVKISINYTLQFADGTGSNVTSSLNLASSNQPNQKIILPFDYDQRHTLSTIFDYRFGDIPMKGKWKEGMYNGPIVGKKNKQILENTGVNVIFRAGSGTPYSRSKAPTTIQSGVVQNTTYKGTRNGSQLPWSFKFDLKLDRDWKINMKVKDEKGAKVSFPYHFNTYILFQNIFNAKNVLGVYSYTGNPSDDGFLGSAQGQEYAASQLNPQSFIDLYTLKVNNPDNYSLPRRIKVGAVFSF